MIEASSGIASGRKTAIGRLHASIAAALAPQAQRGIRRALAFMVLATMMGIACSSDRVIAGAAMLLPGQFDVTPGGAAVYSIPIAVPPGTAGMVPALTLSYSSSGGNGLVGMGWSLGGLPSIGRCPKTVAQDGVAGSVNYDANDRFCIDGERLMVVSGTYGADGSEYRTELEGFSKVIAHGSAGTGPAWFEVRTKSGQIMEFGNTTDSRIEALGSSTVRSWAVSKIADTKGNYLTVTYLEDTTNGQAYPLHIDYTGNAGASLAPYNSVQFTYNTSRPDPIIAYHASAQLKTTALLTNVKTYQGSTLVSDYQITHALGNALTPSKVTSIKVCEGASSTCLPATSFSWSTPGDGSYSGAVNAYPSSWNFGTQPVPPNHLTIPGDFNGDGKNDVTVLSTTNQYTMLSNGNGTFAGTVQAFDSSWVTTFSQTGYFNRFTPIAGDFNADGKTDFKLLLKDGQFTFLSNGDGTFTRSSGSHPNSWNFGVEPLGVSFNVLDAEINGDGKSDIVILSNDAYYVMLGNGDGSFTGASYTYPNSWNFGSTAPFPPSYVTISGDFNGDGKSDIAINTTNTQYILLGNGTNFSGFSQAYAGSGVINDFGVTVPLSGDFNGDGKTDITFFKKESGIYLTSKGDGTFGFDPRSHPNSWNFSVEPITSVVVPVLGDYNGDGRTDVTLFKKDSNYVFLHNGDGSASGVSQSHPNSWNFGVEPMSTSFLLLGGDYSGDGQSDVFVMSNDAGYVFTANGQPGQRITSFTTGLGATSAITYKPLTDASVYAKGSGSTYPVIELQGGSWVVSRVDAANGTGGTYSSTYTYSTARAHAQGRGFLGFGQTKVLDLQTGILQTTNFRQDYPYIGLVSSQTKTKSALTLNSTTNTFSAQDLGGTRRFPFLSQSVEASNDLDGTAMPTVTSTYQYDSYGNPTQIVVATPDGSSKTTTNTYINDTTNWFLGRLTNASVTSVVPGSGGPNQPPTAVDDSVNVSAGSALTFDPRANDTDPDSDTLTITGVQGSSTYVAYAPAAVDTSFTYAAQGAAQAHLYDGNDATSAADPAGGNTSTHAAFDLGMAKPVRQVRSITGASYGYSYPITFNIQYSDTSLTSGFTTASTHVIPAGTAQVTTTNLGDFGAHRYWRIVYQSGTTGGNAWTGELTFLGPQVFVGGGGTQATYGAPSGASGSDSFTYTIDDGHGHTDTATVNVTIN